MLDTRYEPLRLLGTGGMASVWLAHDGMLGRDVAIKRLNPEFAAQELMADRFTREGTAAAALSHPGIVTVYDAGVDGDGPFLVMEHVDGMTLAHRLSNNTRLSSSEVAEIGIAVAEALAHAHQRGVVHRDVKPGNILTDADGNLKLADFGIAQVSWDTSDLTITATQLGTAAYFSPEQALGRPVGPASDVYSLGVMLYRMATGTVPFEGDSPIAVASAHVHETPTSPSSRAQVDAQLEGIIMACLAKDPDRRPAAGDLVERLARIGETPPTAVLTPLAIDDAPATDPTVILDLTSINDPVISQHGWFLRAGALGLVAVVGALIFGLISRNSSAGETQAATTIVSAPVVAATVATTVAETTTASSTSAPTTTRATTTSTAAPTTVAPQGPQTIAEAIAVLADQVDSVVDGRVGHPKFRRELAKRTDDLMEDWDDKQDLGELEKNAERILDEIDEARNRDRVDGHAADDLEATLRLILDMADAARADGDD